MASVPEQLEDYYQITTCTESYFERKGDSALGMGWPNIADAVRRYDVMLDVIRKQPGTVKLLDFGCGTGHLYEHIRNRTNPAASKLHSSWRRSAGVIWSGCRGLGRFMS